MEFASAALVSLLPKLTKLVQDEYKLQKGVKKDIEFLSSELEATHAALHEVGEVPLEQLSEPARLWVRKVREVSYDMEDMVDTFLVRVQQGAGPPEKNSVKKLINKMLKKVTTVRTRHDIGIETKDIKERIIEVASRRDRYKVDATATSTKNKSIDPRVTALYTKVTELVGIRKAKREVMTRLELKEADTADDQQKRIVSIAGFGGLGKTTLAKAIYDEIREQFHCTAFVSVSRSSDIKKLLEFMLYELDSKEFKGIRSEMMEVTQLIDRARKFLQDKRYLIVIDDIWDTEPWKIIGCALIENNMRSRIITTTRIVSVAKHIGGCYSLEPLPNKSSETLFYGRIFGSKDECPENLSEVSKRIMKKCGGVPLALVTTSSLLANKSKSIKEWNDVCESIGLGLESNPDMINMRKILELSYYDLPSHLKTCLLYLSIFPEDSMITKDGLIWRWVAEGFVQDQQGNRSFLEIGENYFHELVNRSLIQPADMDMEGTPHACRVHDTVLDVISSFSNKECFITTILGDGNNHSLESTVRRLSLLCDSSTSWPAMKSMSKLRSLTIFEPVDAGVVDHIPPLSCCHLLRVLDLRGCRVRDLASLGCVGSLSHLRYLGLASRCRSGEELPIEIGKLYFLQALDLSRTSVKELPSSVIGGLGKLMCLRGGGTSTRLSDGLKNLTSLEVLGSVTVTSKCIAEELGYLTQLRVLEDVWFKLVPEEDDADGNRACGKALMESLGKMNKLKSLTFGGAVDSRYFDVLVKPLDSLRRLCIRADRVLTWIKPASLQTLSYLEMWVEFEQSEDIRILSTMECLRHLKLRVSSPSDLQRSMVGPDAFPCVERCEFHVQAPSTVPSMFPRGAMPKLQDLTIWWYPEYCTISASDEDMALAHLPSLRSVTVSIGGNRRNEDRKEVTMLMEVRRKLSQEADVHPNRPSICFVGGTTDLVTLNKAVISKHDVALTPDTVTVLMGISANRQGLDLVCVLDVSGTMAAEKMESMRKAMVSVIMKLSSMDRLSIVTFSNVATRLNPLRFMTPAAKDDLRALVNGLEARGATNIKAGLDTGLAVIADRTNTKARAACIFLMSAGRDRTSGGARQVDPCQVSIYTFGFGQDADHVLLSNIAMKSPGGTFSNVPDGSGMTLPFLELLGGLLTTVAKHVELTLMPPTADGDVDMDTMVVAPSIDALTDTDAATGVTTIKLGTTFAEEQRRVAITFTLKDSMRTEAYNATLAFAWLSFTAQGRRRVLQSLQHINILRTPDPSCDDDTCPCRLGLGYDE